MDCIVFDKVSDIININDLQLISPEFTVTLWLFIDNNQSMRYLISKRGQFAMIIKQNEICVTADWRWYHTEAYVPVNTWTHISVTYNYNTQKYAIYMNGVLFLKNDLKGNFIMNNQPLEFGSKYPKDSNNNKLIKMCQVGLFMKELSVEEVLKVKEGEYDGAYRWWPFNNLNIEGEVIGCYHYGTYSSDMSFFINNPKHSDLK